VKGPPASALSGPILEDATYPDVLVAKAFSHGDDLELVLYPGNGDGVQNLGLERLRPNATYTVTGGVEGQLVAGSDGRARLNVRLSGRTAVYLVPTTTH
jgi:hypothetical protein